MANFPTITVECAFTNTYSDPLWRSTSAGSPTWVDISSAVKSFSIRRGRSTDLDRTEAGTCTVVLDNRDRSFDPSYTSGPYYGYLTPMRWFRISATWNGTTYRLYTGFTNSWVNTWPRGTNYPAITTVTCQDGLAVLARWSGQLILSAPVLSFPAASSSFINLVLSNAGLPPSTWSSPSGSDPGSTYSAIILSPNVATVTDPYTPPASTNGANALQMLQNFVDNTEHGVHFINPNGQYRFINRTAMTVGSTDSPYASILATFGDVSSAGELGYEDLGFSLDDRYTRNVVRISPSSASSNTLSVSNSTSIGLYGTQPLTYTSYATSTTQDADLAALLLWKWKDPQERVTSIRINPLVDPTNLYPQVLARDLMDMVRINRRPWVNGSTSAVHTFDGHIESIQHDADSARMTWRTTYTVSPQRTWAFWALTSTVNSVLGRTTVLGY